MDTQSYKGQILGTYNGLPVFIKVDQDGNMVSVSNSKEIEVLPSASRTVSGNSTTIDVGNYKEAIVFLDVTVVSGTTPTLDVNFQTQDSVSGKWFDITDLTFTQKTGVANEMKAKVNLLGSKIRCVYTIGGTTPSFDFSVGLVLKS